MPKSDRKPKAPAAADQDVTGRYLVLLCKDKPAEAIKALTATTGLSIVSSTAGLSEDKRHYTLPDHCAIVFERIGVALVQCAPDKQQQLGMAVASTDGAILAVEPERRLHAIAKRKNAKLREATVDDEASLTWGIQETKVAESSYTGKGVRLAVLDTGLDLTHPDFSGRSIVSQSFIEGEEVQDENGHGTHCAGIAAGPAEPSVLPRYGVAGEAELYIGKVLSNEGGGADGSVLEGINWAIENGCQVVSMSLGSTLQEGQAYSQIFEEVAKRALAAGTVIIAAAGNDSRRPDYIAPVSHPANCPSIVAIGAVDSSLQVAAFSSGGLVQGGGEVDVAAPGVAVLSAWPEPERYNTISGTSMATPFVAGIAALHAQAQPDARGNVLLSRVLKGTRRLALPSRDVGAGLIQAP